MDSKKANRLLERINALHKSLVTEAENEISDIERDLMLSYIRQLYEEYYFKGDAKVAESKPKPSVAAAAPAKPVDVPKPAPKVVTVPVPEVKSTPLPEPTPEVKVENTIAPPAAPVVKETQKHIVSEVSPAQPERKMNTKVAALFAIEEAKELSDRLAQSPIKDLTRALTINNRVQFANVLFDGNSELMNSVLKRLNDLDSFDSAKTVLADLGQEHDWPDDEKSTIARKFIKLVSRRYA